MDNIKQFILNKWDKNSLSHFYEISSPRTGPLYEKYLHEWFDDLFFNILTKEYKLIGRIFKHEQNIIEHFVHPDFIKVFPSEKARQYKIDDFKTFFKMQNYAPHSFKNRYYYIPDISNLKSLEIQNKLLKTLEEPIHKNIIFFGNPKKIKILETIRSRATKIQIPIQFDRKVHSNISCPEEFTKSFIKNCNNALEILKVNSDEIEELTLLVNDAILKNKRLHELIFFINKRHLIHHGVVEALIETLLRSSYIKYSKINDIIKIFMDYEKANSLNMYKFENFLPRIIHLINDHP